MATSRNNISSKFNTGMIPSEGDFDEIFNSFIHKDDDKADFQMVQSGTDNEHYVTPALLHTGLKKIGIITGNCYMPFKEYFDNFSGSTLPLENSPIQFSVKVFKNGQLLQEGQSDDYTINYDTAIITFFEPAANLNIEVDYWYQNFESRPGGEGDNTGDPIDLTNFLHISGNETKKGLLTFNNTTPTSTSGIVLTNSGTDAAATPLNVSVSGAGSGIAVQNTANGTGIKLSNTGAGAGLQLNSTLAATGDPLQVSKDNVVKAKIDADGIVTAKKFVSEGGTDVKFVKGDGSLDDKIYAEDTKVIHISGNETKDGALKLTHNTSVDDVLTIEKNNSANCLKLVQNSSSSATTSTFDTSTDNVNRKAISVQKKEIEKAFITHDGNVSGTSFTTLNEKADITDGLLTLADSDSPTATAGHAKLYAKTAGTTDLYVMGSDGVEKKIGGVVDLSGKENTIASGTTAQYYRGDKSWQTLDKTAVELSNVDNTSDLNKPVSTATQTALNNVLHKTGFSTETKTGELVIDSGTSNVSGLKLSKLSTPITSSEIPVATGLNYAVSITSDSTNTFAYEAESGGTVRKINISTGASSILPLTGLTIPDGTYGNNICIDSVGNLYVTSNAKVFKIDTSNVVTVLATITDYTTGIIYGIDGNLYAISIWGQLTRITLTGVVTIISNTSSPTATTMCQDTQGNFYVGSTNYREIYKIAVGASSPVLFYTNSTAVMSLITKNSNTLWIVNNGSSYPLYQLDLTTKTVAPNPVQVNAIFARDGFIDNSGTIYLIGNKTGTSDYILEKIVIPTTKVLKTDQNGLVVKTTYLEDVQYVKASDAMPYKVYTASIKSNGTNAPIVTVYQNTIGNIVWTRAFTGQYYGTLNGAFTAEKTVTFISLPSPETGAIVFENLDDGTGSNSNRIVFYSMTAGYDVSDEVLGTEKCNFEIRVYN